VGESINREVGRGFIPGMEFDVNGDVTKIHPLRPMRRGPE